MIDLPTAEGVTAAAERIAGHITRTPLLTCPALDEQVGGPVLLKAECLQRTGSFKIRGATNRLLQLSEAERARGVVAWSSGNHAQGVAAAAQAVATSAKIVMPRDAPQAKIDNTEALGAEIVFYDRAHEDRFAIAEQIAADEHRTKVPPYNDPDIICGQGTAGLELAEQAAEAGHDIDDVLVPVSGGGLLAGVGLAVKDAFPQARLFSVEPESFDDHRRSLLAGQRQTNAAAAGSICDALLAPTPGDITWAVNKAHLAGGYAIVDRDVLAAMAFAFRHLDLKLEPAGAITLAAVLSGVHDCSGRTVALILSGGNVDETTFNHALNAARHS